jgi:cell shape-determining protein MreC
MDNPRRYNQPIILVIISVVLLLLDIFGLFDWLHGGFNRATERLRAGIVEKKAGLVSPVSKDLEMEKELLLCQLEVEKLAEENASARRLLGVKLPARAKYEPAKVLGLNKGFLDLNIGKEAGIEDGAAVLSDGVLLGRLTGLSASRSQVELLTNSKTMMLVGVWPENSFDEKTTPIKAILKGGSFLIIEEITAGEKVNEGDLVASLDFGGIYLIGKIDRVWMSDDGLFKKALIDWLVDLDSLVTVFVAK